MDDLLDVGERGGEGGGRRVTFSSTDNLVISPSPEHDMKQSPPPPQQQQQQQQPEMWGSQGMWVRSGEPYSRSTLQRNKSFSTPIVIKPFELMMNLNKPHTSKLNYRSCHTW